MRQGQGHVGAMRSWFEANPGEYLTMPDMVEKFGFKNEGTARQAYLVLRNEGVVASERFYFADPERPR